MSRYGNDRHNFLRCSSLADYHLGKLYELKGDSVKAEEHYEKFFDLWKDADPGLPELEDAKRRLAALDKS